MGQVGRVGRVAAVIVALVLLAPHLRAEADRYEVYAVRFATITGCRATTRRCSHVSPRVSDRIVRIE